MEESKRVYSNSFSEVTREGDLSWCDGMVSGNGVQGVIASGAPYNETMIYQNINFIMPSDQPRHTPEEVTNQLEEARQAVVNMDDSWDIHGRSRTYDYCFHPSHQLRINIDPKEYSDYKRWTDYETAEIGVTYTDSRGTWERKTFVSREDDVIITVISKSSLQTGVSLTVSIDDIKTMRGYGRGSEKNLKPVIEAAGDASYILQFAEYPYYKESELNGGGFCGVTYIACEGGSKVSDGTKIFISNADSVYFITKSDRTFDLFSDNLLKRLLRDVCSVAAKYTENGVFNYEKALLASAKIHKELFNRVDFKLSDEYGRNMCNEELIALQNSSSELVPALVERAYNQGRYAMICCGGATMSRLYGMWTGEWNCGWNGIYTMDANVNLQSSGMNTGNLKEFGIGYINFILRQIDDWKDNAEKVYRMQDAILVPVNFDGNRAMMVEYDWLFPFQYWNAGASWMLQPVYEFYECFGDIEILTCYGKKKLIDDVLLPLLTMQANFWKQIVTPEYYTDASGNACYQKGKTELGEGEKYLIIPSYSPENNPKGRKSRMTANASMDIAAARDGLRMTINIEEIAKNAGWEERVEALKELKSKLPDYIFDASGALREWSAMGFEDNHEHRHISHLYCAWPAFETQDNPQLVKACNQAIINRNAGNDGHDDFSSHGWLHKALVFARLKNSDAMYQMLYTTLHSNIYYKSMMTDHNTTGRFVYCTDTSLATIGIINEALVCSEEAKIEVLPALPNQWSRGCIKGLMTRCQTEIVELSWNIPERKVTVSLLSSKEQSIILSCGVDGFVQKEIQLKKDEVTKIEF